MGWTLAEYYHSHQFPRLIIIYQISKIHLTKFSQCRSLIIVAFIPASAHSKDVAIRIDSINSAEVYKFSHMIDTAPNHAQWQEQA
jgi:hypothetical protein